MLFNKGIILLLRSIDFNEQIWGWESVKVNNENKYKIQNGRLLGVQVVAPKGYFVDPNIVHMLIWQFQTSVKLTASAAS